MHGLFPPGTNLKLDNGEMRHFEKPFETFNVRNYDKLNKNLVNSALPFDVNPIAEFNYNRDSKNYSKFG